MSYQFIIIVMMTLCYNGSNTLTFRLLYCMICVISPSTVCCLYHSFTFIIAHSLNVKTRVSTNGYILQFWCFVLQDLTLKHGWRTGAIIPELRKEIKIMNTEEYMHMMAWLQALTGLIEQMQVRRLYKTFVFPFLPLFQELCA